MDQIKHTCKSCKGEIFLSAQGGQGVFCPHCGTQIDLDLSSDIEEEPPSDDSDLPPIIESYSDSKGSSNCLPNLPPIIESQESSSPPSEQSPPYISTETGHEPIPSESGMAQSHGKRRRRSLPRDPSLDR